MGIKLKEPHSFCEYLEELATDFNLGGEYQHDKATKRGRPASAKSGGRGNKKVSRRKQSGSSKAGSKET